MTDPHDQHDRSSQMHTGYDMESGVLARLREWTDVFPWLRLIRTLRVAGSPVMLGLVALTYIVWSVASWLAGPPATTPTIDYEAAAAVVQSIVNLTVQMLPVSIFDQSQDTDWTVVSRDIIWALAVWMPVTLYLVRQGALLTAGRELVPLQPGIRRSFRLTPKGWLMSVVPLACIMVFGLMIYAAGWLARLIDGIRWLEVPLALLVVLIALPCGLLGFGAYIAVPLGWAALANEKDPDTLDSLSRGYEYLYRRPLHVVLYALLSWIILVVITGIAAFIALVASWVTLAMLDAAGASESFAQRTIAILMHYPLVVATTLFWALVGGVYLLLRYDAGDQEVEEIWEPTPPPETPLPQLTDAAGTQR